MATMDAGSELLATGQAALERGAWAAARSAFEQAVAEAPGPEALEGLATAAWFLDDAAVVFDARERAFAGISGRRKRRRRRPVRHRAGLGLAHLQRGGGGPARRRMDARARGAPPYGPPRLAGPGQPRNPPRPPARLHESLLEPLGARLSPAAHGRLTGALTLLFGIDPIVALLDNSDIERSQIPALLAWTAGRLVDAALDESA